MEYNVIPILAGIVAGAAVLTVGGLAIWALVKVIFNLIRRKLDE